MSPSGLLARAFFSAAALTVVIASPAAIAVPITADAVVDYQPGNAPANFRTSAAALGNLSGDTTFGGLNPFNPAFSTNHIVWVGAGGSFTLHLSAPIPANGFNLGVYSNIGIIDISADGSGQADNPFSTVGQISRATVSVSQDGVTYVPLSGGAPITFSIPANVFTDTNISNGFQPLGATTSSQSKPFLGAASSFNGQNYNQMRALLNNSAGGTWLDLRNTVPATVNYVKFDVGAGDRMVVDAIGGLGAANLVPGSRVISEDVGTGAHASHVVVDFGPQSYDFIVRYDNSITGEQALQMLQANTDFRLTVEHFGFGDFVTGLDYGGYKDVGDGSTAPLFNDFWSYYTGDGMTWISATTGAGSRILSEGSYDGWVWTPAQGTGPDFATVPEPAFAGLLVLQALSFLRRRRR